MSSNNGAGEKTALLTPESRKNRDVEKGVMVAPKVTSLSESYDPSSNNFAALLKGFCDPQNLQASVVGTVVYTLFQVVFCLAMASAISPSDRVNPLLGPFAKLQAIGTVVAGPLLMVFLGGKCPALYPAIDLFLAPFLAQMASIIQDTMEKQAADGSVDENQLSDVAFMSTFAVASGIGTMLVVVIILLASQFPIANLGAFLPFAVIAGFFSSIGVTLWTLAVSVDMGGMTVPVIFHADLHTKVSFLVHHVPSFFVGSLMYLLGPLSPVLVPGLAILTVVVFYVIMFVFGISLETAVENGWFWSEEQLVYATGTGSKLANAMLIPPAPFGPIGCFFYNVVNYEAVKNAVPVAIAMAIIFFLRAYLHAIALNKTVKSYYEAQDNKMAAAGLPPRAEKRVPPSSTALLRWYAAAFTGVATAGGSAVTPAIPVSLSLFKLGADGLLPQCLGLVFLVYFYVTDFDIVVYIPKTAFSALIVLSALEVFDAWFIKSYHKINEKIEWTVVPLIMVFTYVVGMLGSVFLGIAISTLIFVSGFYRSGVVKYMSNGLTVHSNVERTKSDSSWLDKNGDLIQVLVLQNYLFFGNASLCLQYIQTMFEEPTGIVDYDIPPIPKYLVVDMMLVTGMDTSTVDIFKDISSVCEMHKCKLFLSGMSVNIKAVLKSGGVKQTGFNTAKVVRFFPHMESAMSQAEDGLLRDIRQTEAMERRKSVFRMKVDTTESGLRFALDQIDDQLKTSYAPKLEKLEEYTEQIDLTDGMSLFESHGGCVPDGDRGVFFVEFGLLRAERDVMGETTKRRTGSLVDAVRKQSAVCTIADLNARGRDAGSWGSQMKEKQRGADRNFRVGRVGPGRVLGSIERIAGNVPGMHIAVTPCRLYHLSRTKMAELEQKDPMLLVELFKLMSRSMLERHESAVAQLASLHSIITSTPPSQPTSRQHLGDINATSM